MSIKYSKNVLWLKPFVSLTKNLVPLNKVKSIKGYKVKKGCLERAYGSTVRDSEGKYSVNLKIYDLKENKQKYKGSMVSTILDTLAHELAHTKTGFDHTPEHYELTCRIALKFSKILEKNGIMDTTMRYRE